jgi:hypothetical protein
VSVHTKYTNSCLFSIYTQSGSREMQKNQNKD